MKKMIAAAAIAFAGFVASGASQAAPMSHSAGAVAAQSAPMVTDVQYMERRVVRERRVMRPHRYMRPSRVCTVRTVRERTPRGMVVRKIRTCR